MNNVRTFGKHGLARITYIRRRCSSIAQKVQPVVNKEKFPDTTITSTLLPDSLPTISPRSVTPNQPTVRNIDHDDDQLKPTNLLSPTISPSILSSSDKTNSLKEIKDSDHSSRNWFNRLTSKQKTLFKLIVVSLVIVAAASAVLPPVYLFLIRQIQSESSFTNITASVCSASVCIGKETPYRSSIVTTLFTFDGNTNDQTGYVLGVMSGTSSASYTIGYLSQSIYFSLSTLQYMQSLNINLAKKSFTLQAWIFTPSFSSSNDFGLFGQCDAYNVCLSLSLRNTRVVFSLDSMNINNNSLIGATVLVVSAFTHVTVVYDATLFQQQIYVNGLIDAVSNGIVNSYQGTSSSLLTTIGRSSSFAYPASYFYGRIDLLTISAGTARDDCQILNDASLVAYYPFSTTDPYNDYGVNLCNGIAFGTTIISSGRVGQAISFTSSSGYFQSQCVPRTRSNDPSYSLSIWINPTSTVGGGSLVHLSSVSTGNGTCYDLLGLTASGAIVLQWIMTANNVNSTQGPVIPANTWTHVAVVYQTANGIRLYINGQFSASSPNTGSLSLYELGSAPLPWYITLGNNSPLGPSVPINCPSGSSSISSGPFSGAIDEFRFYNRELDNQELCALANP